MINLKDTFDIQLASLDSFAQALGYWRNVLGNNSFIELADYPSYKEPARGLKGCRTLSFNTVVKLHNAVWLKRESKPGYYYPDEGKSFLFEKEPDSAFVIDGYKLNQMLARKICHMVYLQADKHGVVSCHKHWLKLADSSYETLFLGGV